MDERMRRSRKRVTAEKTGICAAGSKIGLSKGRKKRKRKYEVKKQADEAVGRYELVLEERGGNEERIYGSEIGLSLIYDGTMEAILKEQNPLWRMCRSWQRSTTRLTGRKN